MKEGVTFILAVVLLLPPVQCPGNTFVSETTLFGFSKEDTTRNQRLSYIYNTVPEQFHPNIRVCALCCAFYGRIFPTETASQYVEGRNVSVSCLRYSANHNTLDSWPIRARLASQNDELCKN